MHSTARRSGRAFGRAITCVALGGLILLASLLYEVAAVARLPQSDHPAELYSNQLCDDLRMTMTAAITDAKQSVVLMIYNLTDDSVIAALRQKAAQGVPVRVIVDAKACPAAKRRLGSQVTTLRRSPTGLMHLKVLVIDEQQVWIGSANMTYDSLRVHGNLIVAIHHPELARAVVERALALPASGHAPVMSPLAFALSEQEGELWFLPGGARAYERVLQLIGQAQSRLSIAMFTWTRPDFVQAVIAAAARGVQVEVFIDRRQGQGAGAEVVHDLVAAGIPVCLSRGDGLLHHKTLVVDDRILVTGSANWTRSAFKNNDDCFLVLNPLTAQQRQLFAQLWNLLRLEGDLQNHLLDRVEADSPLDPMRSHQCAFSESLSRARRVA